MVEHKKKLTWKKPKILFELPFENTAAGLPGEGSDGTEFGFSES